VSHACCMPALAAPSCTSSPTTGCPARGCWRRCAPQRRTARTGYRCVTTVPPPATSLYALAHAAIALCRPLGVRVAVNDRLDVALAVRADGVQVGGRGLPVGVARSVVGSLRLGVSVHGMGDALQAQAEGADWVTLGHIFSTSSHPDQPPRGVAAIRQIAGAVQVPVIAIGGIDAGRVAAVLAAGAGGVAVISAILDTPHPGHATAALRAALDRLA